MTSSILAGAPGEDITKSLAQLSSFKGHAGTAEDVANSIAFLASGEAAAITGINILIDTGLMTGIGGKLAMTAFENPAGTNAAPPPK